MKNKKDFRWLDEKIKVVRSFDGSLLKYVGSSGSTISSVTKLRHDSSTILKLDANENFFVSRDYLNSMFTEIVKDVDLRLYDPTSIAELKETIGKYVGVPSKCITVSSGSEQLIDLVTRLFLEEGNNAISIVPTFFIYEKRVMLEGAKLVKVPLNRDLSVNVKAILEKTTPKTRLVFVCSPNNPTGNQFELDKIEALADECSAIVVIDEAYAEFADYSVAPLAAKKRNVIVLRTFSKAFGLAGMRFGYAITHEDVASLLSGTIPYTVSTVAAKYVSRLLGDMDAIEESIELTKAERTRLIGELKAIKNIEVFDSKTNFVTFRPHGDADSIYHKLLEKGIITKNLGYLPVIGHCLRVTVGLPDMNSRFLSTLRQILA